MEEILHHLGPPSFKDLRLRKISSINSIFPKSELGLAMFETSGFNHQRVLDNPSKGSLKGAIGIDRVESLDSRDNIGMYTV